MIPMSFPPDFLFGASTSAYQIEGGWNADGKGPSIWDVFTHQKGKIHNDDNADVAANTYADFQTDIELMRQMGLGAYRFSIAWSRVLPRGRGAVNPAGLDYYERLVDALLAAGIMPFPTLFHWDLPQALEEERGGFAHRDTAAHFADYAEVVVRRLGDRVNFWTTFNEPWVHASFGYMAGMHAPGRRNPWAFLRVVHHQLLGHGLAVERIKSLVPGAQVGITLNFTPFYPATKSDADRGAADMADQLYNRLFLDPLTGRGYPPRFWRRMRPFRPKIAPGDMEIIARPIDYLGVNYYTRSHVRYQPLVPVLQLWPAQLPVLTGMSEGEPETIYTDMGWEVYPAGLYELLFRLKQEYGNPPVYITENGAAFADEVGPDGRVRDELRQRYLEQHLAVTSAAMRVGADVRGYFAWSLLDNFEWAFGYDKRFGIVRVDYATQQRTIKDSGHWYAGLIRDRGQGSVDAAPGGTEPTPPASNT